MLTGTNRTVDNRRPVKSPAPSESKLRPITPAETDVWAAALRNQSSSNFEFVDLDEPHEYPFKVCVSSFYFWSSRNFNFNHSYSTLQFLLFILFHNLKDQDPVWVRTKEDNWYYGRVTCRSIRVGHTRYVSQLFSTFHIID